MFISFIEWHWHSIITSNGTWGYQTKYVIGELECQLMQRK
jgi:hypothetical protein